jgi:hypothetical protein
LECHDLEKNLKEKETIEQKLEYLFNTWCVVQNINSTLAIRSQKSLSYRVILLTYGRKDFDLMGNISIETIRRSNGKFFELVK